MNRERVEGLDRSAPGWRSFGSAGLATTLELSQALDEIDRLRQERARVLDEADRLALRGSDDASAIGDVIRRTDAARSAFLADPSRRRGGL